MLTDDTSRAGGGVGDTPNDATTRAELGTILTGLRQRSGRSLRDLAASVGSSPSTLSGWCRADNLPFPSQFDTFRALVRELGVDEPQPFVDALVRLRTTSTSRSIDGRAPYLGLEPFGRADADRFVGREALVARTLARIDEVRAAPSRPALVLLVGASGSGKSSLLHAGVRPALEARGEVVHAVTAGAGLLAGDVGSDDAVLVVDQLEELFTATDDVELRARALARIAERADAGGVIATLRIDFYAALAATGLGGPWLADAQVLVGAMTEDELRRAVVEPARRAGCDLDDDLVELLLRDFVPVGSLVGRPDAGSLPLLSHALLETYRRSRGGRLTVADYQATGGVHGAVERSAEQVYDALPAADRERIRQVLLRLVHVENGVLATRRVATYDELDGLVPADADGDVTDLLEPFVTARLLTAHATTVDITHEALLTAWPRLQEWIEQDRDAIRLHRRISEATRLWLDSDRDDSALARGVLLEAMRGADTSAGSIRLTPNEAAFLAASEAWSEAEVDETRRRTRRLRALVWATTLSAVLAVVLAVVAADARAGALQARDDALSRQLSLTAERLAETDPSLGAELAVAGYALAPTAEARAALLDAAATPRATRYLGGPGSTALAASADGALIAVGDSAGATVQLLHRPDGADGADGHRRAGTIDLDDPALEIYALALTPDVEVLAVGDTSARISLWDVRDPDAPAPLVAELRGPDGPIQHLAVSPDGRELVAVGAGEGAFRWDVTDPADPTPLDLLPNDDITWSVAYDPTGTLVAVGDEVGRVTLWEIAGDGAPASVAVLEPSDRSVLSVAFAPDGRLLAAGTRAGTVHAWQLDDPSEPQPVTIGEAAFDSWINAIGFRPDGTSVAAGSSDGELRVWSTDDWELTASLRHPAALTSVAFTRAPDTLLTAATDGIARIWEVGATRPRALQGRIWSLGFRDDGGLLTAFSGVETGWWDPDTATVTPPLGPPLRPPADGPAFSGAGALSADGRLLAHGTLTGEVLLYEFVDDASARPLGPPLSGSDELIEAVVFAPDGGWLAAAGVDTDVRIWTLADPAAPVLVAQLTEPTEIVLNLAVDPTGRLLAAPSADGHVYLFDLADPASPVALGRVGGFESEAFAAAFWPDSSVLAAAGSDAEVRLWDVSDPADPQPVGVPLTGPSGRIFDLSVDADGARLAAGVVDGRTWVWDVVDPFAPEVRAVLGRGTSPMYAVAFHPDGRHLAASGADGEVQLWDLDTDAAIATVCGGVGDPITPEEWQIRLRDRPYDPPC